jgi:hypothetical protein
MRISKRIPEIVGLVALVFLGACDTLNIANGNDPDRRRALGDPNSIPSVAQGAFQTWYLTSQGGFGEDQYPALTMSVMARSHVAMWNNYHIRFYTGCTTDWPAGGYPAPLGTCGNLTEGPAFPRAAWANSLAAAERTQIEAMWYGYYASLSSANDALTAIRTIHLAVPGAHMVETMSVLTQGLALSGIALNYDQGFIVDYNTDVLTIALSPRVQVRDAALAKFDEAITLAAGDPFTVPGSDWFGGPAVTYDNVKIAKIANTMAARLLAYFARNAAENATVDWARVAGYAAKGISSGTKPFDLTFHQDACTSWCDFLKVWSNDMTTMRVHTRVAHMMDAASQPDPWDVNLNHNPNSADKRLGDGTYRGDTAYASSILRAYPDTTGNGGYDYVWTHTKEFGNKTRGAWHQSAVGQVRYDSLTTCGDNPQGASTGAGDAPMVLAAENDLLWAEALIRGPAPDLATAATLINYTRHGPDRVGRPRGGLPLATAGDANLLQELQYEQDVELMGSNIAPFYNQRRIDNLEPLTPHEMPVPAQELGVLKLCSGTCYTWGGAGNPPNSSASAPGSSAARLMQTAPQIWTQMYQERQARMRASQLLRSLQ